MKISEKQIQALINYAAMFLTINFTLNENGRNQVGSLLEKIINQQSDELIEVK